MALASHQTGHNSGVIHAGVYYAPGSLKAKLCRAGERATEEFCITHGILFRTTGKLIVATNALELERMGKLEDNARANGIAIRRFLARNCANLRARWQALARFS